MGELAARNGGTAGLVALALVILVGLGLRIGWAVDQPSPPPPDALAYERIAAGLYEDGSFDARPPGVEREIQPSSAYAPGLPLLVSGLYFLSGGVHLDFALIVLALLGAIAVPLTYLLGRRMAGPLAGLLGAGAIAIYPALLQYQGVLLTEPLAATLLVAALLAFINAACPPLSGRAKEPDMDGPSLPRPGMPSWALAGVLFGLLALVRPEYLTIAFLLPLAWVAREAWRGRLRSAVVPLLVTLLGTALVLAPWAIRNAIVLDRAVPVSTGGGKALYIGTHVDADGDGPKLRELLLDRRPALRARFERDGPVDDPQRLVLERVLAKVAAESHPGLEADAALGRLGRQNLSDDITQEPLAFAEMLIDKAYATWTDTPRAVMGRQPWRALQLAIVILALAGLVALALRRRFEAVPAAIVLAYMTMVGALLISSPRRELVVLPLLAALAGVGATWAADSLARWRR
ncbi:MAG TPA: STT3 domain-containing protein [Solirubrobacterales bacterium]